MTNTERTEAIEKEMGELARKMQIEYSRRGNTKKHQEMFEQYQELETILNKL